MNAVVVTTIHEPTKAIKKIIKNKSWKVYVVGDLKTPHGLYQNHPDIIYLSPEEQHSKYEKISDYIGWNTIQRRNIGFIQAYKDGAEIIATLDDDNIPKKNWGENLQINKTIEVDCYENVNGLFDPLSVTNISKYWHRGYPVELVSQRKENIKTKKYITSEIEVGLWDGYPDADAVSKIAHGYKKKKIKLNQPFASEKTIFSSQNAFIHRNAFPNYCVLPHVGRLDDIWGCILYQQITKKPILFSNVSTIHKRDPHNIVSDLRQELFGYEETIGFLEKGEEVLPFLTRKFLEEYRKIIC